MPGPCSQPKNLTEQQVYDRLGIRRHRLDVPTLIAAANRGETGKTAWDHATGKWASTRANKARRLAENKGRS